MNTKKSQSRALFLGEKGAVAVYTALILSVLVMFASLSVDVGHLYGVRNELHNAADAGALSGAHELYNDTGHLTASDAEDEAKRIGGKNKTGKDLIGERNIEVEIGHWSFGAKQFTPIDPPAEIAWQEKSFADLDKVDSGFVNAIRVTANRPDAPSFLAKIFGISEFFVKARAVAYLGFAGTVFAGDVDQPVAICKQSITTSNDAYSCSTGRMISDEGPKNTAGWTSFNQENCHSDNTDIKKAVCKGNTSDIVFGKGVGTTGGQTSVLPDLRTCWNNATGMVNLWPLTLTVIDCPSNNVGNCSKVLGVVTLNVVWITGNGEDKQYKEVPTRMGSWNGTSITDGEARWASFVNYFHLKDVNGNPAAYSQKSIYYLPDCNVHVPLGQSGGENFGILAKIPKLVQ